MRIFRRKISLIILVFVLQVIVFSQLALPFTSNSHSYSFRKVRGKPTQGNFVLNLKDYGLSEETALGIKRTLKNHFPTHFSGSEEITLNLARDLDQLELDVGEILQPIIETIVKISENDIDNFIANKTGVKYFAIAITDGEYGVKENLEGLLIKLIKDADKYSSDDPEQFRKNLKALGGETETNSTLVEILKLAEVKVDQVIGDISDIAGFLANGDPHKYRLLLATLPRTSIYIELEKDINRGEEYSEEFVPVIKGKLATYILKNILPKCIKLAGGNLENYNLGGFDEELVFKNLDSIKYFGYELKEENISPFSLLKISLPFVYKASMDLKERHILKQDKQKGIGLIEFRSKEFRKSIYAVEETILFLKQKVKDLEQAMESILNDVFESATGRPWWFRDFLWRGVERFGRFLLGKGIKLDQVLVKSVHAANLASRSKKGSFLANIESIQKLVGKLEDIGLESDEIGKILIREVPKKAKLSGGNPELFKDLLKGIITENLNREITPDELEEVISLRINNIKAIVLDFGGTMIRPFRRPITSLFKGPDKKMINLLNKLDEESIPIAILTISPLLARIKLGKDFYIGKKEDILDFMKENNLEPHDLAIVANDYLGQDKILLENAPGALVFNVGKFSHKLPSNLISTKQKGPQATKEILTQILNLLTENE